MIARVMASENGEQDNGVMIVVLQVTTNFFLARKVWFLRRTYNKPHNVSFFPLPHFFTKQNLAHQDDRRGCSPATGWVNAASMSKMPMEMEGYVLSSPSSIASSSEWLLLTDDNENTVGKMKLLLVPGWHVGLREGKWLLQAIFIYLNCCSNPCSNLSNTSSTEGGISLLASGVYQMNRKGGRSRRGQKKCRHEPHHLQKARGWYFNSTKSKGEVSQ